MAGSIYSRKCASDFWRGWKRLGRGARGRKRAPAVVTFNGQELDGVVDVSFRTKVDKHEAGFAGTLGKVRVVRDVDLGRNVDLEISDLQVDKEATRKAMKELEASKEDKVR